MSDSVNGWQRVNLKNPCPVCGKPDWCLVQKDRSAAICPRVAEGSIKDLGEAGYLHKLTDDQRLQGYRSIILKTAEAPSPRMAELAARCTAALSKSGLAALSQSLGLSVASLERLQIGWSAPHEAWTFPMRNAVGQVVGVRTRKESGFKFSVSGGSSGLHIPADLGAPNVLLFAEGPTDAAAGLDLGFATVGRPSCLGAIEISVDLVRTLKPKVIAIVADNDGPGVQGATKFASSLALHAAQIKIVTPPQNIKDLRDWLVAGATTTDLKAAIDAAPVFKISIKGTDQ